MRRDFLSFRIRLPFDLNGQEHAILFGVLGRAEVGHLHAFADDDLDSDLFALAQAFLEILLGPQGRAGPRPGQHQSDLVAPGEPLRVQERGQLPGDGNLRYCKDQQRSGNNNEPAELRQSEQG